MYRVHFEKHIRSEYVPREDRDILERSGEGYLDLYVQLEWLGWKAALACTNK